MRLMDEMDEDGPPPPDDPPDWDTYLPAPAHAKHAEPVMQEIEPEAEISTEENDTLRVEIPARSQHPPW